METDVYMRSYLEKSEEYFKLKVFKIFMRTIASFAQTLFVGTIMLMALMLLSLAASFGIGNALDSTFQGFLIVGLCYVIVGILCYIFRDKLNAPLLRRFSGYYFDEI